MKKNDYSLLTFWMKVGLYYTIIQTVFISAAFAAESTAQVKSLDEVVIAINLENASLEKALSDVELSTNYQFAYDEKLLKNRSAIYIKHSHMSVKDVLLQISKQANVGFQRVNNKIDVKAIKRDVVPRVVEIEDDIDISGKITDENGEGLPGASIVIKGTVNGTTSDVSGNYALKVPDDAILSISYIGYYTQEITVAGRSVIDVQMRLDAGQLEEVVVVGYGTQKKSDLTGAVSTVKGDQLLVGVSPNLSAGLAGKLTGVITSQQRGLPGFDEPDIRIRGVSSLNNNSALVIVDGIERPLSRINPNEIESITVLKDAASAAIYGARAANGVLLVTTKRGGDRPASFNYTGTVGVQSPTIVPKLMNAEQYATYIVEAQKNSNPGIDDAELRYTPQDIEDIRSGKIPSTDWYDELVSNGSIQQHNLSVDGGNKKTSYYFSFGHMDQKGLYETSGFKSYSLRSNVDTKVGENLSIGLDLAGRLEETRNTAKSGINTDVDDDAFGSAEILATVGAGNPTFAPFVDGDGDGVADEYGYDGRIASPLGRANGSGEFNRKNNLLQSAISAKYDIPFLEGLSIKGRYSFDAGFRNTRAFRLPFLYYSPDGTGGFSENESIPSPTLTEERRTEIQKTSQISIGYEKKFGENAISGLLLYEQVVNDIDDIESFRDGFLGTSIDQFLLGSPANASNGGKASSQARLGYVGRVNYNRSEKYLFQANFRYDGSYRFKKGNQFGFFPAASAAWRISEEDFFPSSGTLSSLKVRASWGKFGNDRVDDFQYQSQFDINSAVSAVGGVVRTGLSEAALANENITWEKATGSDIGLELGFLDSKIQLELDYFWKSTKDILIPSGAIPDYTGATLPDQNIGETKNSGLEVLVRYSNDFGGFKFNTSGNVTYATSEVIRDEQPIVAPAVSYYSTLGQPIDVQRGYVALGLFQSREELSTSPRQDQDIDNPNSGLEPGDIKYQDINNDGVIDGADRTVIGKSEIPELIFGLNFNMSYKGFGLVTNFQGASGFTRYIQYSSFVIESNSNELLVDAWRPGNEGAEFPRLTIGNTANNDLRSTFWLNDMTYLRLRNVEFSYTFPNDLMSKVGVENLKLFVSANNLLTLSNVKGVDPEGPSTERQTPRGGGSTSGPSGPYFGQLKSILFGINLSF